ncbi:MAG: Imm8 family immunity protein [Acidobacteriota bacterium]
MIKPHVQYYHLHNTKAEQGSTSDDPYNCSILVSAAIGATSSSGTNLFYFQFVTPQFLLNTLEEDAFQLGRGLIIVPILYENAVEKALERVMTICKGKSWDEVTQKLARYGRWEYEDAEFLLDS